MKLQAPENCGGASFGGETIELDEKGQCVVMGKEAIDALMAHGFVSVKAETENKPKLAKKD